MKKFDEVSVGVISKNQLLRWGFDVCLILIISLITILPVLVRPTANEGYDLLNHIAKSYYLSKHLPLLPATDTMQGAGMTFLRSYGFLGHYFFAILLKVFKLWTAFKIYFAISVTLAAFNTYLLARFFKVTRWAALLSAACYVLSPFLSFEYFVAGTAPHWLAYAIFPLFLFIVFYGLEANNKYFAILSGWILGVMLLIHPQIALRAAIFLAIILIVHFLLNPQKIKPKTIVYATLIIVLCLLTTGFKIYEGLDNLNYVTGRNISYSAIINNPYQFINGYISFLKPMFSDHKILTSEFITQTSYQLSKEKYLGIGILVLAAYAIIRSFLTSSKNRSNISSYTFGLLAGSIAFAFIFVFPDPLYNLLPLSTSDAGVSRVLFVPTLGIAILAGIGFDTLCKQFYKNKYPMFLRLMLAISVWGLCFVDLFYFPTRRLPLEFGLSEPDTTPESITSKIPRWKSITTNNAYTRFITNDNSNASDIAHLYNGIPSIHTNMTQDFVPEFQGYLSFLRSKIINKPPPYNLEPFRLVGIEKVLIGDQILDVDDPLVVFQPRKVVQLSGKFSTECFLEIADTKTFHASDILYLAENPTLLMFSTIIEHQIPDEKVCNDYQKNTRDFLESGRVNSIKNSSETEITRWEPELINIDNIDENLPWVEISLQFSPYWKAKDIRTDKPLQIYKTSAGLTAIFADNAQSIQLKFKDPAIIVFLAWIAGITSMLVIFLVCYQIGLFIINRRIKHPVR